MLPRELFYHCIASALFLRDFPVLNIIESNGALLWCMTMYHQIEDHSVSLYRLKQDIFITLATCLKVACPSSLCEGGCACHPQHT